jgi:hypothetical protein
MLLLNIYFYKPGFHKLSGFDYSEQYFSFIHKRVIILNYHTHIQNYNFMMKIIDLYKKYHRTFV